MSKPRILLYDLETSPAVGYVWGKYDQTVHEFVRTNSIMSVAWKWHGEKKVHVDQVCDYENYDPSLTITDPIENSGWDDTNVVANLFELFNEADVIVGHNSRKFDDKMSQGRFLYHKMGKPSPALMLDTLVVLRKNFKMTNYFRLDNICDALFKHRKVKHEGMPMWIKCLNGDLDAWEQMRKYAKQDVVLLDKLFTELKPWVQSLNYGVYADNEIPVCSCCGSKDLQRRGFRYTGTYRYQRFQCNDCGKWNQSRTSDKSHKPPQLKGEV